MCALKEEDEGDSFLSARERTNPPPRPDVTGWHTGNPPPSSPEENIISCARALSYSFSLSSSSFLFPFPSAAAKNTKKRSYTLLRASFLLVPSSSGASFSRRVSRVASAINGPHVSAEPGATEQNHRGYYLNRYSYVL